MTEPGQSQIWAAFARRGLGVLAHAASGDTTHILASFETPSQTGRLKIYDDPLVAGETVRVLLADSNYTQPTAKIQVTGSSGDLEDVLLRRTGSLYFGSIPSSRAVVARQNGVLNLTTGDAISAFYVDFEREPGQAQLISASAGVRPPYTLTSAPPSFTFSGETRLTAERAQVRLALPFEFPFFSQKHRTAVIYPTGVIGSGFSAFTNLFRPGCNDAAELARFPAIAPLFANLTFGSAQPNEGVYVSTAPGQITFRWAAEH